MNFYESYQQSVKANRIADMELSPDFLIPNIYKYVPTEQFSQKFQRSIDFLHMLAGGNVLADQLFSFSFLPMDCHMILCTYSGGGRIVSASKSVTIPEQSLFFFDCSQKFSVQSMVLPWKFKLFFIQGHDLTYYKTLLNSATGSLFILSDYSPILREFNKLISIPCNYSFNSLIKMHQSLTQILSELSITDVHDSESASCDIPYYLSEMKDFIDNHYAEPFSLDNCEDILKISKYRLCREFSKYFGDSPVHYLKSVRLNKAKEMLLTTDLNIHEISSLVGYENVNHFINLFKKDVGTTPNVYRHKSETVKPANRK